MTQKLTLFFLTSCLFWHGSLLVKQIDNGIAPPEIVHEVLDQEYAPRCTVVGKPLDLLFVLDSSGSLKNKFQDELDVIREIVNTVAIGQDATRVSLVQFSGVQRTEFHFNTFYNRRNVFEAVDTLRHVSGITKTGAALNYSRQELTTANGMRGPEVPKLVFLLSDGRTHDYPEDKIQADRIRTDFHPIDIWAYGTGDYVAIGELINITRNPDKIVTNKNLHRIAELFAEYKGTEVCKEVPVCIPGSDKPLDLMFIFDASNSLIERFTEQRNFMHRVLNSINVHPKAVRLALISYSGTVQVDFDFKKYRNNDDVHAYINKMHSYNGTTRTQMALRKAFDMFEPDFGIRDGVPRMAIIITDGHALKNPAVFARRLVRLKNVTVAAVAVSPLRLIDTKELLDLTDGHSERVFTRNNLDTFETWLLQYISFGCNGRTDVEKDSTVPFVRGPTDTRCTSNAVTFTVRTRAPFNGFLYVRNHLGEPGCTVKGNGETEVEITIVDGSCGLKKTPVLSGPQRGYQFNLTAMIQFNEEVITDVDQALDVSCFHEEAISNVVAESRIKDPFETVCQYTIRKFGKDGCVALDGRVGESMDHRWECSLPANNYAMLVHDCMAESDAGTIPILDDQGCHVHPFIMEDPIYTKGGMIYADMSVFKFPGAATVKFQCFISLCDMESTEPCKYQIPPKCTGKPSTRTKRQVITPYRPTKQGFIATFKVETRRLNVLESENLKPRIEDVNYCSTYSLS